MHQPNAKILYADIFRIFIIITVWIGLGISLLSRELIIFMTGKEFWGSYETVPLLVIGGFFYGTYYLTQTGIYIHKRTKYIAYLISATALVKIVMSWFLIEYYQAQGAAISVALSFALLTTLTYLTSQKMYFIQYSWSKILKTVVLGGLFFIAIYQIEISSIILSLLIKSLMIACFPVFVIKFGIISQDEFSKIRSTALSFIKVTS